MARRISAVMACLAIGGCSGAAELATPADPAAEPEVAVAALQESAPGIREVGSTAELPACPDPGAPEFIEARFTPQEVVQWTGASAALQLAGPCEGQLGSESSCDANAAVTAFLHTEPENRRGYLTVENHTDFDPQGVFEPIRLHGSVHMWLVCKTDEPDWAGVRFYDTATTWDVNAGETFDWNMTCQEGEVAGFMAYFEVWCRSPA